MGKSAKVDIGFSEVVKGRITDFYGVIDEDEQEAKVLIELDDYAYYILNPDTPVMVEL